MRNYFPLFPSRRFLLGALVTFALMASALPVVNAAPGVPELLHYQGRLLDDSGNLLGGSGTAYCFRFSFYDDETVGAPDTQLWPAATPSDMTATATNGVFAVSIGDTLNGGDVLDYTFTDDTTYLNIEIADRVGGTCGGGDETYENLSPRQRINSSGYAINAGSVFGTNQSAIGTTSAEDNTVLTVEATSTNAIGLAIRRFAGQVANLFNIISEFGESLFTVNSNGNVGVGTSTPYAKLSVVGEIVGASFTATTTATSTFAGGVETNLLNITATNATSTFANGIILNNGCVVVNGSCLGGSSVDVLTDLSDVDTSGATFGNVLTFDGSNWIDTATSSLAINTDDLVEGSTNLFWTNNRFDTRLTATTSLPNLNVLSGLSNFGSSSATTTAEGNLHVQETLQVGSGSLYLTSDTILGSGAMAIIPGATTDLDITLSGGGSLDVNSGGLVYDSSTGNVGVGTSSPYRAFSVAGEIIASIVTATNTATSSFTGGIATDLLQVSSTTATSTFAHGIEFSGGCVLVNGNCLSSSADFDTFSELDTLVSDKLLVNLNDAQTFQSLSTFGAGFDAQASSTLSADSTDTGSSYINFEKSRGGGGIASGDELGAFRFSGFDGLSFNLGANIEAVTEGVIVVGRTPTSLRFSTEDLTGSFGERMRIAPGGNVGIGTTSPFEELSVAGDVVANTITGGVFMTNAVGTSTFSGVEANLINVTATNASSSFANGINLSDGCFAVGGVCVGSAISYVDLIDTPSTITANAIQYGNSGGTAITQAASFTFNGTTFTAPTTNLTGLLTAQSGFVSQASSTVVGDFTVTGNFGLDVINVSSTTATSTFANGIQLTGGCFETPDGNCLEHATTSNYISITVDVDSNAAAGNINIFDQDNYTGYSTTSNGRHNIDIDDTNGRFTINEDGVYLITLNGIFENSAISDIDIEIHVNGSPVYDHGHIVHNAVDGTERTVTILQNLVDTDFVEFYAESTGGNVTVYDGTSATIMKLGPVGGGGGGGGGSLAVEEEDVTVHSAATTLDFGGNDFIATNSGGGEVDIDIDYSNSGITRDNQNETITSEWLFAGGASSTELTAFENIFIGGTATTTLSGNNSTSTFAGGIETNVLNITATGATSTFANGIDLTGGCFSINDICLGSSAVTAMSDLSDADTTGAVFGNVLTYDGANWVDTATSALAIALADTTGTLTVGRGGTGSTTPSQFLFGNGAGGLVSTSTIAQNFIDSAIARTNNVLTLTQWYATTTDGLAEGSGNLYYNTNLFAADLLGTTTDALSEGSSNLYWTDLRFDTRLIASSTVVNLDCGNGQVAKANGTGGWTCGTDIAGGGGGGSSFWATSTDDLVQFPTLASRVVLVGGTATTSTGNIFEVIGSSQLETLSVSGQTSLNASSSIASDIADANPVHFNFEKSRGGGVITSGDSLGFLRFTGSDGSNFNFGAGIEAVTEGSISLGQTPTSIRFSTENLSGTPGERVRITPDGALGVGTTGPAATFSVQGNALFSGIITVDSTSASSSFSNGINLTGGCFSINGTCVGVVAEISDLSDADTTGAVFGNVLTYDGANWVDTSTSSLQIAIADTTGTLAATRGGTGLSTITNNQVLVGGPGDTVLQLATSSLGLLTTDVAEGTNLYWTDSRFDTRLIASSTVVNLSCGNGQVAKADGLGGWNCGADVAGGGGGSGLWATSTDDLAQFPTVSSRVIVVGGSATTSTGNIFEVIGASQFDNITADGTLSVTGQTTLGNATSSQQTIIDRLYVGSTNQTIIRGGSSATSTFGHGVNLETGCFAIGGTCLDLSGDVAAMSDLSDADTTGAVFGNVLTYDGANWVDTATSALAIALADTTGTLTVGRGGTGSTTPSQFLFGNGAGGLVSTSTIAQNFIDSAIARVTDVLTLSAWFATDTDALSEGINNLYWTNNRFDTRLTATTSLPNLNVLSGLSNFGSSSATTTAEGNLHVQETLQVGSGSLYLTSDTIGGSAAINLGPASGSNLAIATLGGGDFTVNGSGLVLDGATGNVGVGTSSPYEIFAVGGNIVGDGTLYIDNIITDTTQTSSFAGDITTDLITVSSTTATSTFSNGIMLSSGCITVNGNCLSSSADFDTFSELDTLVSDRLLVNLNDTQAFQSRLTFEGGFGASSTSIIGSESADAQGSYLEFNKSRSGGGISSGDELGGISFYGHDNSSMNLGAAIEALTEGTIAVGQTPTSLRFSTESLSGTYAERLRITPNGLVGIGSSTPYEELSVSGDIVANTFFADDAAATSTFAGLQANLLNVTATNASSSFANGINITNGCFSIDGACVGSALEYTGLTDTPGSFINNAIQYANSGGTALTQSSSFTFTGTTFTAPTTNLTGLLTAEAGFVSQASSTVVGDFTVTGSFALDVVSAGSTTATSTFANGIQLNGGCFEDQSGSCLEVSSPVVGQFRNSSGGGDIHAVTATTVPFEIEDYSTSNGISGSTTDSSAIHFSEAGQYRISYTVNGRSNETGQNRGNVVCRIRANSGASDENNSRSANYSRGQYDQELSIGATFVHETTVADEWIQVYCSRMTGTTQTAVIPLVANQSWILAERLGGTLGASGGGGSGGSLAIQEEDSTVLSTASTLDFGGADFIVTNSGGGEVDIDIDYSNSGITREGQAETITGQWSFQGGASSTEFSVFGNVFVGGSATTTISGNNSTSTFAGGIESDLLNITGSATSTFANGIQLDGGCVLVGGICLGSDINYLSLTDTPGSFTANAIQFANSGASGLTQDAQFVFDAATNRLGVGTSTPAGNLDIYDAGVNSIYFESAHPTTEGTEITFRKSRSSGGAVGGDDIGALLFTAFDGLSFNQAGAIEVITEGTVSVGRTPASIRFSTDDLSGDYGERARITPGGDFGIATTAPVSRFSVSGDSFLAGDLTVVGTIHTEIIDISSTTASSTFANGLNITDGCFSINGVCLGSSAVESASDLSDVDTTGAVFGNVLTYDGVNWVDTATSALAIALADTTGTLATTRGGTGLSTITNNQLLIGGTGNAITQIATSSLGLLTTHVEEGTNLYWTDLRFDTRLIASSTVVNLDCGSGQVAKADGIGGWNCGADIAGSSGGSGLWATSSDALSQFPTESSRVVIVGGSATTSTGNIFEVIGASQFDNISADGSLSVTGQTTLGNATSSQQTINDRLYVGTTNQTIIRGGNNATSTFGHGIDVATGCVAVAGTCIVSATNVVLNDIQDVSLSGPVYGNLLMYNGSDWVNIATSTLEIALADTTGTLAVSRGGTGRISLDSGGFLFGNGTGAVGASSSPTVGWITATSTTATSTFANGISVASGCVTVGGECLTVTNEYIDLEDTPSTLTSNSLQYANAAGTALEQIATFVYDSVNATFGVGTSTPQGVIHTYSTTNDDIVFEYAEIGTDAANLEFRKARGTAAITAGDEVGSLTFTALDGSAYNVAASIDVVSEGSIAVGRTPSSIRFSTDDLSGSFGERMRISPDGNVGIGTTSPYETLSVAGGIVSDYIFATSTATSTFTGGVDANVLNIVSTTATSTFANGLLLSNGCVSVNGNCLASQYVDLADTPLTLTANAIQYANSGGTAITQSSNFTFDGSIVTQPATNMEGLFTAEVGFISQASSTVAANLTVSETLNAGVIIAASTTATSTFAGGINVTGGCIAINGNCLAENAINEVEITTFTANGTWTKADYDGLTFTQVIVTAGGGGGGGGDLNDTTAESAAGGGGGGGTTIEMLAEGALGATEAVTVGTGGTGGVGAGANGTAGSNSQFGAAPLLSANGGGAGDGTIAISNTCTDTPLNAAGGAAQTNGDINLGGGGSGASHCDGEEATGGSGGASYWGGGGSGGSVVDGGFQDGFDGIAFGSGGGGGAAVDNTSDFDGGDGADGVVVTYNYSSSGGDLAEWYETKEDVEAGDVVAISSETFEYDSKLGLQTSSILEKAKKADAVVGVISHAPFVDMGYDIFGKSEHPRPVALAGRVPVKVSEENGAIKAGDLLTLSSEDGVAMRSTKAGTVLGRALEDSACNEVDTRAGEHCMVLIMVNTSYSTGALLKVAYRDHGLFMDTISGDSHSPEGIGRDVGRAVLAQMINDKKNIVATTTLSEVFTDRVIAGLEIISPRVVTDTLVTNAIEPVENELDVKLTESGTFIIERVSEDALSFTFDDEKATDSEIAVSIDALGNALFSGVLKSPNFEVGSADAPGGVTMYDTLSNEPFCTVIEGGELKSYPGKCSELLLDSFISLSADEEIDVPLLRVLGNNPAVLDLGSTYVDPGAVIESPKDQNLGIQYEVNGEIVRIVEIDTSVEGEHRIIYRVVREDGTEGSRERTVYVGIEPPEAQEEPEPEAEGETGEEEENEEQIEEVEENETTEVVDEPTEEITEEETAEEENIEEIEEVEIENIAEDSETTDVVSEDTEEVATETPEETSSEEVVQTEDTTDDLSKNDQSLETEV